MKIFALAAVFVTVAAFASTASAQSEAPPPSGRSTQSAAAVKTGKPYYIEFRARNALSYGHTFAVIGRSGAKLTKANVVGLHPATESSIPWMVGHLVVVPSETGWSDGDIENQYIIARYRVPLSEPEYRKLMAYVTELKAKSPVWHAVLYNCNAFVGDIAKHMGLQIPSSSLLLPKAYITELRNLNTAKRAPAGVSASAIN